MKQKKERKNYTKSKRFADWLAKLLSFLIAVGLYFYYQSAIQDKVSFTLPLNIIGIQGHIASLQDIQKVTLHLEGKGQDLENLRSSDFETYVRFISRVGSQKLPVMYRLRNNNLQLSKNIRVKIEPDFVALTVERKSSKELPIKVRIQGYPATGFSLGVYRVYPDMVNVIGPTSILQKLSAISTKSIDITGKSESFQKLVELQIPIFPEIEKFLIQSLTLAFERVQVEVQIDARIETRIFQLQPRVTNLPKNLKLRKMLPKAVELTLQGNSNILQSVEKENLIIIELDAGDIFTSGRYALPVVISDLPTGVRLLNSRPNRISLILAEN